MDNPIVIDIGSGCTKIGLAGNSSPQYILPTCVAKSTSVRNHGQYQGSQCSAEMNFGNDFYIGDAAYKRKDASNYLLSFPVKNGRIDNFDDIERFLLEALFRTVRCNPQNHLFCMTEPPFNTPENRELMAEVMFETFNVKGLTLKPGAVLALFARMFSPDNKKQVSDLTGVVVDAGDSLTQVIPVSDGYVITNCVQEIPLGGKHVDQFISDMLTNRAERVPPEDRMAVARNIKEQHTYVCRDVVEEYRKFDTDPKKFKTMSGENTKSRKAWSIAVGYERFLAPEIFFNPEIFTDKVTKPLDAVVDECIQMCPLDTRRQLYANVVLSGGSTSFLHFRDRFQRDLKGLVDKRLKMYERESGSTPKPIDVKVEYVRGKERYAAWLGGSLLAMDPKFQSMCKLKKDYDEIGPACMRGDRWS